MEATDMLKILYCKSRDFRFQDDTIPTKGEIEKHWQELPEWVVENLAEDGMDFLNPLEEIYRRMNHYDTNPLAVEYPHRIDSYEDGETPKLLEPENPRIGQEWMKENGVGHTSMSVGDIIVVNGITADIRNADATKNGYYYCMKIGFDKIHSLDWGGAKNG